MTKEDEKFDLYQRYQRNLQALREQNEEVSRKKIKLDREIEDFQNTHNVVYNLLNDLRNSFHGNMEIGRRFNIIDDNFREAYMRIQQEIGDQQREIEWKQKHLQQQEADYTEEHQRAWCRLEEETKE